MRSSAAGREPGAVKAGKEPRMKAAKKVPKETKAAKMTKPKRAAKRLLAVGNHGAATEAARRARHLKALSCASGAERELEELVFGDSINVEEDELLRRLAGPRWVTAAEGKGLREESSDSEVEDEAKGDLLPKKPVWVDEDDEAEENVDMTHKYRKDFMKSDAETTLTKKKLKKRLEEQFQQAMGGVPAWADLEHRKKSKRTSSDSESDEEDDLLRRTGNFITSSESLPRGILKMSTCLPANQERFANGKLVTVQFHPSAQVVMTAGHDRSVSLFQVDGIRNPKIQSIYLENFPIYKARFSVDGEQVIATGTHHSMFFVYDMIAGSIIPIPKVRGVEEKFLRNFELSPDGSFMLLVGTSGYLHLLSMKTKELISTMKVNGRCTACAFTPDSSKIYSYSKEGEVFIWDVRNRRCLHKFEDEGSLEGKCIALSKNNQYVACGSSSGVVNLYTTDACLKENHPKPVKAIMNLVTSATCVTFNPTTEILAVASRDADEAVKLCCKYSSATNVSFQQLITVTFLLWGCFLASLVRTLASSGTVEFIRGFVGLRIAIIGSMVHLPSYTVFSNFPVFRRKQIYLTQSMDFSPRSGYFSIANNKGKALLFRLKHYSSF